MKIKSAQLDPDALANHFKNVVVVADPLRGIIVRSKPKRKKPWSKLQTQYRKRFALAGIMASNPERMQLETAIEMAKGTQQVPRDILTMAALGNYYEFVKPDGTIAGHVEGPVYVEPQQEPTEMEWWSQFGTRWYQNSDGTGNAFKGNYFTPGVNLNVKQVKAIFHAVNGETYKAIIGTRAAGNTIGSLVSSNEITATSSSVQMFVFDLTTTINAGDDVFVATGRTDGPDNYIFRAWLNYEPAYGFPYQTGGFIRIPHANPMVGDGFTLVANRCYPSALVTT